MDEKSFICSKPILLKERKRIKYEFDIRSDLISLMIHLFYKFIPTLNGSIFIDSRSNNESTISVRLTH